MQLPRKVIVSVQLNPKPVSSFQRRTSRSDPRQGRIPGSKKGNKIFGSLEFFFNITPLFAVGYISEVKSQVTIQ